jgi:hypothetical protein
MTENNKDNKALDWVESTLGDSRCGAKWYNATIWLGSGMTASCHHPQAHKIDIAPLAENPSALHNTAYKKLVRGQMQAGVRPKECEYCWKIEDLSKTHISDRYYKSAIYTNDELTKAFTAPSSQDFDLKTLEISFDSNCNLACSYCNASFSTKWAHDIDNAGPYQNLDSDVGFTYAQNGKWTRPYGVKNEGNPYLEAFWKWWESTLRYSLTELRITGGEAILSNSFWQLMDWYTANPECNVRLAINSNLVHIGKVKQLVKASKSVKNFHLFTSNESFGGHAEYIRDGLIWEEWKNNLIYCLEHGNFKLYHIMFTVNALCLASLTEFLDFVLEIERQYGKRIEVSFNILRFPSFQSVTTLPENLRKQKAHQLSEWLAKNGNAFESNWVSNRITAVIDYLQQIDQGHASSSDVGKRQSDFKQFFTQYDIRRNKSFAQTFADWPELVSWYNSVPADSVIEVDLHNELIPNNPYKESVQEWGQRNKK